MALAPNDGFRLFILIFLIFVFISFSTFIAPAAAAGGSANLIAFSFLTLGLTIVIIGGEGLFDWKDPAGSPHPVRKDIYLARLLPAVAGEIKAGAIPADRLRRLVQQKKAG